MSKKVNANITFVRDRHLLQQQVCREIVVFWKHVVV